MPQMQKQSRIIRNRNSPWAEHRGFGNWSAAGAPVPPAPSVPSARVSSWRAARSGPWSVGNVATTRHHGERTGTESVPTGRTAPHQRHLGTGIKARCRDCARWSDYTLLPNKWMNTLMNAIHRELAHIDSEWLNEWMNVWIIVRMNNEWIN